MWDWTNVNLGWSLVACNLILMAALGLASWIMSLFTMRSQLGELLGIHGFKQFPWQVDSVFHERYQRIVEGYLDALVEEIKQDRREEESIYGLNLQNFTSPPILGYSLRSERGMVVLRRYHKILKRYRFKVEKRRVYCEQALGCK
jgi:hypothetical protein